MGIFLLRTDKMKLSVVCETTHSELDVLLSPPLKVPPFKNSPPLSEYTIFPHMASSSSGKDPGLSSQWSRVQISLTLPLRAAGKYLILSHKQEQLRAVRRLRDHRGVAEWLKAAVFKTVRQRPKLSSWVRILPPLPIDYNENRIAKSTLAKNWR